MVASSDKESEGAGLSKGKESGALVDEVREREGLGGGVGLSPDRMLSAFIAGPSPSC